MATIKISNLDASSKKDKISNFLLSIAHKETACISGDDTSGRHAVVEALCGTIPVESGNILADDEEIHTLPVNKRKIICIRSDYGLFSQFSVRQNIEFGLLLQKLPKEEREQKINKILKIFSLLEKQALHPPALCDEDAFRTALARACAIEPRLIILDEPFNTFDIKKRMEMIQFAHQIQNELEITTLYSLPSPMDVMGVCHTVAIVAGGYLEQYGNVREVYDQPSSLLVANITGEINVVKAQVVIGGDFYMFSSKLGGLNLKTQEKLRVESEVDILIRPEYSRVVPLGETADAKNVFSGKIKEIRYMMGFQYIYVQTEDSVPFLSVQDPNHNFKIGDDIDVILTRDEYPVKKR